MTQNPKIEQFQLMISNKIPLCRIFHTNIPVVSSLAQCFMQIIHTKYQKTCNINNIASIISSEPINSDTDLLSLINIIYNLLHSAKDIDMSFCYLEALILADNFTNMIDNLTMGEIYIQFVFL